MPLTVHPCTPSDFPRTCAVERAAWSDDPFSPILFPGPFPEGFLEFRIQEMAKQLTDDPTTRWLKVVDSELTAQGLEDRIAFAKWNVYDQGMPETGSGRQFGDGCNVEACEMVFGGLARQRERLVGGRKCVYLSILITDPAHGRRGAGGLLIKWGVDEAKKYNLPLFVESSRKGHELYGKYGFKDLECHELDLSKWGAKEPHRTWAMVIEPDEAR